MENCLAQVKLGAISSCASLVLAVQPSTRLDGILIKNESRCRQGCYRIAYRVVSLVIYLYSFFRADP